MSDPVVIVVPGAPVAKERPRFVSTGDGGFAFTPKKTRGYEDAVALVARREMAGRALLAGPVTMSVVAALPIPRSWKPEKQQAAAAGKFSPTTRPDLDNYAKLAADSLTGIVYLDDRQIVFLTVCKIYAERPSLRIEIASVREERGFQGNKEVSSNERESS